MNRNRILSGLLLIGSIVFASYYGGRAAYSLLYFFMGIPVICGIYCIYVYMSFRFIQEVKGITVVKEEPVDFVFTLSNERRIAFTGIRLGFLKDKSHMMDMDESRQYVLMPGDKEVVTSKLCCKYRGEYVVGLESITVSDFLGLFSISFPIAYNLQVTVRPRLVPWSNPDFIHEDEDEKRTFHTRNREEEPDVLVRPYMQGDSLKRINWKVSAKEQQLFTRTYRAMEKQEIVIFLDLSPIRRKEELRVVLEDGMIEQTLSLLHYCMEEKLDCSVAYQHGEVHVDPIRTRNHLDEFFTWSAKANFLATSPVEELPLLRPSCLGSGSHMIFVVSLLSVTFCTKLLEHMKYGNKMSVILITDYLPEAQYDRKKSLEGMGIRVLVISYPGKGGSHEDK